MAGMALQKATMWVEKRARTITFWFLAVLVATSIGMLLLGAKPAHAKTFTVDTTADLPDPNLNDDACVVSIFGGCTLRAAIEQANATDGADIINFNISGSSVKTISPDSELPNITERVTINGYSQPGASPNTNDTLREGTNAKLLIELNGTNIDSFTIGGLSIAASAPNSVIKGLIINRFNGYGIFVQASATGNRVQGNFIGTNALGTEELGNGAGVGIASSFARNNVIGGTTPAARNLISGNNSNGVEVLSSNNQVLGNLIGTRKDGIRSLGNDLFGVSISAAGNSVGGTDPTAANAIAFSRLDGIVVFGDDSTGNRILRNSIFSNSGLGIDLGGGGPTANDAKDPDAGPNTLQNKPTLLFAVTSSRGTTIGARLNSTPSKTFTVQFYSNSAGNEGKVFRGQTTVSTEANGNTGTFTFSPANALPVGQTITATATGPGGNTSEFSAPTVVTAS